MNDFAASLLWNLGRTSIWLAVAAVIAVVLLKGLRCRTVAVHRIVWLIVLLTGWLFVRPTVTLPWHDEPAPPVRFSPSPATEIIEAGAPADALPASAEPFGVPAAPQANPLQPAVPVTSIGWPVVVVAVWLLGGLLIAGFYVVTYLRFLRDLPFGLPLTVEWEKEWHQALAEASVKSRVRLCVTEELGPFVCRVWREHRLVVPASLWGALSSPERCAILRHELAHVRRRDLELSLLARLLALPHWFNPLGWWAVRNFEEAGEWACDDAVRRRAPGEAVTFAQILLQLGEQRRRPRFGAAIGGRSLSTRIKRLLIGLPPEDSVMKRTIVLAFVGIVALFGVIQWRVGPRSAQAVEQAAEATLRRPTVNRVILQRMTDDAAKTYVATKAGYDVGTAMMSEVYVWSRRWLDAERAMATSDAEDISAVRAHRERMKQLMLKVRALYITGTKGGEMEKFFATKFYVAEADAWVSEAKNQGREEPKSLETVSVGFRGPKGMDVTWDEQNDTQFDGDPVACPTRHDFEEGGLYFLQFGGFGGPKIYATVDVLAAGKPIEFETNIADLKRIADNHIQTLVYFLDEKSDVAVATAWDDLSRNIVAETEKSHQVLAVMRLTRWR